MTHDQRASTQLGVLYALAAYLAWGFIPVYFKQVQQFPPLYILGHRICWSVAVCLLVVCLQRQSPELLRCLRSKKTIPWLAASTTMLATNWFVFIWAVNSGRILQASLGYYINPLVNVLLGFLFLRERLRTPQLAAFALAAAAVATLTVHRGQLPWVSLTLAATFGLYGLLRKTAHAGPLVGTAAETILLLPVGLSLIALGLHHPSPPVPTLADHAWLPLSGIVTTVPLLWFAAAARRLRLATIGIIQYLSPTVNFLLAVFLYNEPFKTIDLLSFCLIWTAVILYSADSLRAFWIEGRELETADNMVKE